MNDEWSGNAVKQTIKDHETEKVKDSKGLLYKSNIESLAKSPAGMALPILSTIAGAVFFPVPTALAILLGLAGGGTLFVGIFAVATSYAIWKHIPSNH